MCLRHSPNGSGTGRTLSVLYAEAPISLIRVVVPDKGMVEVESTPHYEYVLAYVGSAEKKSALAAYRLYNHLHWGMSDEDLHLKERSFRRLIFAYRQGAARFEILVKWEPEQEVFRVVDGFHRLSIMSAISPSQRVPIFIVS